MARREEATGQDHFDLLPFISILMAVLGCLLLVTMSMAALSVGPGLGQGWIPDRTGCPATGCRIPVLVEWNGLAAVVHLRGAKLSFDWSGESRAAARGVRRVQRPLDERSLSDFDEFLDLMETRRKTHYVLFAVRPSGFGTLTRLASEFRSRGITVGYEPLGQDIRVEVILKEGSPRAATSDLL